VPTLAELGHDFEVFDSYRGIWTSKDVPDEAVGYYIGVLEQVVASNDYRDFVEKNSIVVDWIVGDELEEELDAKVELFRKIAEEMNLVDK